MQSRGHKTPLTRCIIFENLCPAHLLFRLCPAGPNSRTRPRAENTIDAIVKAKHAGADIEIKNLPSRYPGIARATVEIVRALDLVPRVIVSSFDHELLRDVISCDEELATARTRFTVGLCRPDHDWSHREWGEEVPIDRALDQACPEDYDALLLPGGVMNPDRLRTNPQAVTLVKLFFDSGKPIAVICHGPWTLIEAGVVRGVKMTSYPSIKTDLRNAGAHWIDDEVVVDQGIVSSRRPADLPAFNCKMIEVFNEGLLGPHARQPRVRAGEKANGIPVPPLPAPPATTSRAVVMK